MWWAGAAFLVAGNVIIGRKDESKGEEDAGYSAVPQGEGTLETEAQGRKDDEDEDVIDLGDLAEERR